MATTTNNSSSFFDKIPREIRDQIYEATFDYEIERQRFTFTFQAPCPHLRLVSHQFKDEYDERDAKVLESTTPLASAKDLTAMPALSYFKDEHGEYAEYNESMPARRCIDTILPLPGSTTPRAILSAQQSIPDLAKRCTSLKVDYFMHKARPAEWGKKIDLTPLIPDVRRIVLSLGLRLQRARVTLIWESASAPQSFAIRCELATQAILSRLRTMRSPVPEFKDAVWLFYRGNKHVFRFAHCEFDSCGEFFRGPATGGTWHTQKSIFTIDGLEDEDF